MYDEKNTGSNLPAQVDLYATPVRGPRCACVDAAALTPTHRLRHQGSEYHFHFMAKGGGSANKTFLYQETKARMLAHTLARRSTGADAAVVRTQALLNPTRMMSFLEEKIATLGTSACPPYHLALVVGGMSAEQTLKTVKYASARYYDNLPTRRAHANALCLRTA